jgi:hypothetical protein
MLRAAETLGGESVRCAGCGAAVSIPPVTDRGSAATPATPATPDRAADPAGRSSAPTAPSAPDWWDDVDARLQKMIEHARWSEDPRARESFIGA